MRNYLTKLLVASVLLALALATTNASAQSKESQQLVCPGNFEPIPAGLACKAVDLAIEVSYPLDTGDDCPRGFEYVAGVPFCVAVNLALDVQDSTILLKGINDDGCPPNFSVAPGSTICTADNLMVKEDDGNAVIAQIPNGCPEGFHRPVGVRFCIAENLSSGRELKGVGQFCPPGFAQPPGVRHCTATALLYQNNQPQLPPPVGECPDNWYKPENVNFCIPSHKTTACGNDPECLATGFVGLKIHRTIDDFEIKPCPEGTLEIWWDMPVYDDGGLFVVDFVPTRTCIAEGLQPAG